ncbi:ATP-binding protein (plasmid) [Streptosporangium sp. NBC_01495]|uniref:ATP-binding protein n=1 Tax=Streptosporangium sp. NBC_01495 TaxID=2903899 RepID=UPI002E354CA4|nr:ATP-binding protein [Streptosporangium sp. NBC_01495]
MTATTPELQYVIGDFCLRRQFTPKLLEPIRRFTEAWLAFWQLSELADPCLSIVTELCANVRHTPDRYFELTMSVQAGYLRMNVRDHSPILPDVPHELSDPDATSGRGLYVVARYADRVGVDRLADGKEVWAEIALQERVDAA